MKIRWHLLLGRKAMANLGSLLKSRHHFANKGPYSQSYGLSSSHVQMWELDNKEGWEPKNWCFQAVVLEKILDLPLKGNKIKSVNLKGNQQWILLGRTDADAEAPILLATWCEQLIHWKRPWCWERLKAEGEEGDRGWDGWLHHRFNRHELGQTTRDGEGHDVVHGVGKSWTWTLLVHWTTANGDNAWGIGLKFVHSLFFA